VSEPNECISLGRDRGLWRVKRTNGSPSHNEDRVLSFIFSTDEFSLLLLLHRPNIIFYLFVFVCIFLFLFCLDLHHLILLHILTFCVTSSSSSCLPACFIKHRVTLTTISLKIISEIIMQTTMIRPNKKICESLNISSWSQRWRQQQKTETFKHQKLMFRNESSIKLVFAENTHVSGW
jgi:hypothetical protein